ncbi:MULTISPECIES: hypothetical protein [unclassified Coleofasciculus]|uniref:hypothetical protein n=1 Tax=unclassified Coleofasciculus TaxID=2692782 RepID=UPI00187F7A28|nr:MULTISPECIES: hypothetical protein [unclassified Coleofasciculus]MBE9127139.1 hypothetical protein [Coleofasciculus sp. LEGE 07081]MBE9152325.1 hypothetical protein [Coleofasciculus sp. LEGE 07092]
MLDQDYISPLWTKRTGACLGAIALSVTTLLLPGCTTDNEEIQEGKTNVTTEDVAENTESVIGQEITVRSLVGEAVGKSGFVMNTEEDKPILVINATGTVFTLPAEEDMPVQATGQVAQFVLADVEKEYGLDLEDELYVDYEEQPAIIAQSLALAPTTEELAAAPTGYFDKVIAVEGDVRKLEATNNALALFEEGWVDDIGVLVVGVEADLKGGSIAAVQEGENITVTGTARQADAKLLKEANLGWDDAKIEEFLSRYTQRPVIVADGIYPSAVDPAPGE